MPDISVIIPTYNRAPYLALTLAGFAQQTIKDWELVLLDDGSTDETRAVAESFSTQLNIVYIRQDNAGRSAARNHALQVATGDIILFSDDDRIPCPEFVAAHLATLGDDKTRISVGQKKEILTHYNDQFQLPWNNELLALFARNPELSLKRMPKELTCVVSEGELEHDFEGMVSRLHYRDSADNFDEVVAQFGTALNGFLFGWVLCTTGNLAFHRTENSDTITFDEHFSGWGMEDTDFGYQLVQNGYQVVCSPHARNYHQLHPRGINETEELRKNLRHFCEKHAGETDLFALTQKPGANLLSLFVRFVQRDYTLPALNQIAKELTSTPPHMFMQDYLRLSRARARHILMDR